jgi:hypothetical protein
MQTINRCLEITPTKRAELEEYDRRHLDRKKMIAARRELRSLDFGNRKERRREAARERQWLHTQIGQNGPDSPLEKKFATDMANGFIEIVADGFIEILK